jgi:hypothetical protein
MNKISKKTLVIHPNDPTTSFLDVVYLDRGWTIVNDINIDADELTRLIIDHERIIMLGHGTPNGLLTLNGYIIKANHVALLRLKDLVCMWCNADLFVQVYGLKGFYTGMIISEEKEANYCYVPYKPGDVDESNVLFTKALKESIDNTPKDMYDKMKEIYIPSADNKVMKYNAVRLYYA